MLVKQFIKNGILYQHESKKGITKINVFSYREYDKQLKKNLKVIL